MNSTTLNRIEPASTPKPHFLDGLAARAVHQRLARLAHGQVTLVDGTSHRRYGQRTARCPLSVTLQVHDPRFYSDIAFGGSIGAAGGAAAVISGDRNPAVLKAGTAVTVRLLQPVPVLVSR